MMLNLSKKNFIILCLFVSVLVLNEPMIKCEETKIKIVATIAPLGLIAKEIGGERVEVKIIVPSGSDPHQFVPSPYHRKLITECNIFLSIGKEQFLRMLGEGGQFRISWNDWIESGIYINEEKNPHYIWLYPPNAKIIAKVIFDHLVRLDPQGKNYYITNLKRFNKSIDQLKEWVEAYKRALEVEEARIVLIASHFEPLIEYLGFRVVTCVVKGGEKKPGPLDISRAIKRINEEGADAIVVLITAKFGDEGRIAKMISASTGVPMVYLSGVPLHLSDRYMEFIKSNIITLLTAIKISREGWKINKEIVFSWNEIIVYLIIALLYAISLFNLYINAKIR